MCSNVKRSCSDLSAFSSYKPKLVNCGTGRVVLVAHGFEHLKVSVKQVILKAELLFEYYTDDQL